MATPPQAQDAGGSTWRLQTPHGPVIVWMRADDIASPPADVVAVVHGYGDRLDEWVAKYKVLEQLAASGRHAVFIIPGAPLSNAEAVDWVDLESLLGAVQTATGLIRQNATVTAVGHSGAFRTILAWLRNPRLKRIVLVDALYAGVASFGAWVRQPGRSILDIVTRTGTPHANAPLLAKEPNVTTQVSDLSHFALITPGTSVLPEVLRRTAGGLGGLGALAVIALIIGWAIFK